LGTLGIPTFDARGRLAERRSERLEGSSAETQRDVADCEMNRPMSALVDAAAALRHQSAVPAASDPFHAAPPVDSEVRVSYLKMNFKFILAIAW
jgi:hypothetical protein